MSGFFTQPRLGSGAESGAGLAFSLADSADQLGAISGVLAFAQGGPGASVTTPATQQRDIAIVSPDFAGPETFVARVQPADYALDGDFRLVSMPGETNTMPADPAHYALGTSTNTASDVSSLVMLRWGRWAGGTAVVTNLATNSSYTIDLSQRSLHWVQGGDSASPPVMPQFGTATYALIGATNPTDRSGHTGILHNAAMMADFTNQAVAASFNLTVNDVNVTASGNGSIGAVLGLPAHQFAGSITTGTMITTPGLSLGTPQGTFSGFFSAPGGTQPGVPGGAALTYSITDGMGGLAIDGAAAFRGP
jgi:hypothetical protein